MRHALSSTLFTAVLAVLLPAPAAEAQTIRDASRLNVGGFNPNGDNQQDGTSIAVRGSDVYAVWAEQLGTTNFTQDIYFARSTDDGATFSAPIRVDLGEAANANDSDFPKIAAADNGNLVVVWEERRDAFALQSNNQDLFYNVSTDGGLTWRPTSLPLNTSTSGSDVNSDIDRSWLTVSGNTFHCTWEEDSIAGAGGNEEVFYTRSTDAGLTWSTPIIVSPATGTDDVDEPKVAADGSLVIVTWVDVNNNLAVARSTDGGATFSAPFIAESDVTGDVDEPQLEVKGSTVLITYNENDASTPGGEGVHVVVSNDGGATFRPEVTLSVQAVAVAGSDCDVPQCFIESASNMYVVYDEDSQAVAAGLPGGSGANNLYIAYTKDGGATWTKDVPISFDTNANRPEIVVANGFVVVAAELGADGSNTIAFFVSQDGGATFAPYLEVPSSGPDTDFVNRNECTFMAVSNVTNTVSLVYLDRTTGANEVYTAGLLLPNGVGTQYCTAAVNSTGSAASLMGEGSLDVTDNAFALNASALPPLSFGFFITSQSQGFVMNPGGSSGNLCVAGSIGRYVGSGQIKNSGAAGAFSLDLDLTQTPQPTGFVSITSGQTWNFQAWYRDSVGGQATSNFTNGLSIDFI
ncbi:BNR/Asp-box repeat protein [Planctomycetes bacterium Poly30]|uniref:exo-alpha-sialidase n=1 Tax=Saltatorellus ferox TaxID=2528018 RepID=A0A518EUA4_9BACT|nr:BNR/Asp-box repeat protein [Planctomycetes bacterium Poly30]